MSGNLNIIKNYPTISLYDNNVNMGQLVTDSVWSGINIRDTNGESLAEFSKFYKKDGYNSAQIYSYNKLSDGTKISAGIATSVNLDGTRLLTTNCLTPDNAYQNELVTASYVNSIFVKKLIKNTFYVDQENKSGKASDTADLYNGRGLSPDKPFKTLTACIDFISLNYSKVPEISILIEIMSNCTIESLTIKPLATHLVIRSYNTRCTITGINNCMINTFYCLVQFENINLNNIFISSNHHSTIRFENVRLDGYLSCRINSYFFLRNVEIHSNQPLNTETIVICVEMNSYVYVNKALSFNGTAYQLIYMRDQSMIRFEDVTVTNNMTYVRKFCLDTMCALYCLGKGANVIPTNNGVELYYTLNGSMVVG